MNGFYLAETIQSDCHGVIKYPIEPKFICIKTQDISVYEFVVKKYLNEELEHGVVSVYGKDINITKESLETIIELLKEHYERNN